LSLRSITLNRIHLDIVVSDIGASIDKIMPKGTLVHLDILDENILGVVESPHDWSRLARVIPGFGNMSEPEWLPWETDRYILSPPPLKVPPPNMWMLLPPMVQAV
jgi:hypothetical protein